MTLTRAATNSLTVDYATSDGTATAGDDYTSTGGTLTIGAGSSSGSIEVAVLDDEHNEGSETLTMTLSNATAGTLTDATATGTITNHDALPAALTARFGRAAAVHVLEQVEERVNAPRAPGFDGRFAGRRIDRNMGRDFALELLQGVAGSTGMTPRGLQGGVSGMPGVAAGPGTRPEAGFGLQAAGQPGVGGGLDPRGGLGPMGGISGGGIGGGFGGFSMGGQQPRPAPRWIELRTQPGGPRRQPRLLEPERQLQLRRPRGRPRTRRRRPDHDVRRRLLPWPDDHGGLALPAAGSEPTPATARRAKSRQP